MGTDGAKKDIKTVEDMKRSILLEATLFGSEKNTAILLVSNAIESAKTLTSLVEKSTFLMSEVKPHHDQINQQLTQLNRDLDAIFASPVRYAETFELSFEKLTALESLLTKLRSELGKAIKATPYLDQIMHFNLIPLDKRLKQLKEDLAPRSEAGIQIELPAEKSAGLDLKKK